MCQDTTLKPPSPSSSTSSTANSKNIYSSASTAASEEEGEWICTTSDAKRLSNPKYKDYDGFSPFEPSYSFWPTTFASLSLSFSMLGFGLWIPFIAMPEASAKTYEFAFWHYDPSASRFDNSAWTWVTDYILAFIMAAFTVSNLKLSQRNNTDRLCNRVASLTILYAISVTAGGIAHSTFLTAESRNTLSFQLIWTLCVGTVSLASISMGCCGSEIVRKFQSECHFSELFREIPLIPEYVWYVYGCCVATFTAWGGMSFQRPACDIFIAGVTQTPATFYMMFILFFLDHPKAKFNIRILGIIGFILNAPLLPLYPILIQYTSWPLAAVNTLLHCWLTVAWSLQAFCCGHVIRSVMYTHDKSV